MAFQTTSNTGSTKNLSLLLNARYISVKHSPSPPVPEVVEVIFLAQHRTRPVKPFLLLTRIIKRLMKVLTRKGLLLEEQGMSYLDDSDPDRGLGSLAGGGCTYRIALGSRAGQKVLTL